MARQRIVTTREWQIYNSRFGSPDEPLPAPPDAPDVCCCDCGLVLPEEIKLDFERWGLGVPFGMMPLGVYCDGCGGPWRCTDCYEKQRVSGNEKEALG